MTQLRQALQAVGIRTVEERLRLIAIEVLAAHAHSREAAAAALYARVCHDTDLLAGLFEPYRDLALKRLLGAVESEMRRYELANGKGHVESGTRHFTAPTGRHGGGQPPSDDHVARAPARPSRDAQDAVGTVLRLTMLDTFKIDGTPIGDMQAGVARAWARREGRHVRWVVMLTANMPATDTIRRWISADDADALWARSQEGEDA